ncbi:MAG: hypothetical protein ACRCWW_03515 [Scandinavium sp.]|uniref:hypothetical protein n=1 Tax=Scandinavium sp. TaxID=2830653 RepID=UPI003F2A9DC6
MKLIKLSVLAMVIVSGSAFATGLQFPGNSETTNIYQNGYGNGTNVLQGDSYKGKVNITQNGANNLAGANQIGANPTLFGLGAGSEINVNQFGTNNASYNAQSGDSSKINVTQANFGGAGNYSNVSQSADNSAVNVTQYGNANWANVNQY